MKQRLMGNIALAKFYAKSMMKNKRGVTEKTVSALIVFLVFVAILFQVAAQLVPEAQSAGDTLNASGVPLGSLFAGSGVIFLIIMAAILIGVVRSAMAGSR